MSSPSPKTELRLQDPEEDPSELLKKLSAAIALGNASEASEVVAQLSNMHLKVDINLKSDVEQQTKDKEFSVRVHVEDRLADGCFINLQVRATDTIQDLKNKVMLKHNFPVQVQRWIIGKKLPGNGDRLSQCGVKGPGHTLYLYLVTARSAGLNSRHEYEEHRGAMLDGRAPVPQPYFQPASPHQLTRGQSSDSMWPRPPTPSDGQSRVYSNSGSPYESSTDLVGLSEIDQNGGGNFTGPSRQASKRSLSSGCSNLMEMLNSPNVSGNLPAMSGADNKRKSFSDSSASGWNEGSQREGGAIGGARSPTPPHTTPPRTPPPDKREHEEEGWACPACTYVNLPTRPGCEMCSSARPADYKVPSGYQMTAREKLLLENDQRMERMTREAVPDVGSHFIPRPPADPRVPSRPNSIKVTAEQLRENLQFIQALNIHNSNNNNNGNNNEVNNPVFGNNPVFVPYGSDWHNLQEMAIRPNMLPGAVAFHHPYHHQHPQRGRPLVSPPLFPQPRQPPPPMQAAQFATRPLVPPVEHDYTHENGSSEEDV